MDLKKVIKALLLSTSEGLAVRDIQDVFKRFRQRAQEEFDKNEGEDITLLEDALKIPELVTNSQIREAIEVLNKELEDANDVYQIIETREGYQLVVNPHYATWVRLYRNDDKPIKLSPALMETLALVAYRQPITRAEMELVRGVSIDNAINRLLEFDLIVVQGHANLPGKPRLYVTTGKFLSFCGIQSLGDLPASDILSPQQISEWVQEAGTREKYTELDLGLSFPDAP